MKLNNNRKTYYHKYVTPCVGVWIEIKYHGSDRKKSIVTPCVGVWIEITVCNHQHAGEYVTPCVGVWIEIFAQTPDLKYPFGHSLCGSVD